MCGSCVLLPSQYLSRFSFVVCFRIHRTDLNIIWNRLYSVYLVWSVIVLTIIITDIPSIFYFWYSNIYQKTPSKSYCPQTNFIQVTMLRMFKTNVQQRSFYKFRISEVKHVIQFCLKWFVLILLWWLLFCMHNNYQCWCSMCFRLMTLNISLISFAFYFRNCCPRVFK